MSEPSRNDLDLQLDFAKKWWDETKNPLYAWEAIAFSLNADPPLPVPDWCLPYLAKSAAAITQLSWGYCRAQRGVTAKARPEIAKEEWEQAKRQLPSALGLAEERKKNYFSRRADDAYASSASLDKEWGPQSGTRTLIRLADNGSVAEISTVQVVPTEDRIQREWPASPETAKRILARGRKLTRQG